MPCPEVVAVSYIRQAENLTPFSVEGDAQVKQQNTTVGFLTTCAATPCSSNISTLQLEKFKK